MFIGGKAKENNCLYEKSLRYKIVKPGSKEIAEIMQLPLYCLWQHFNIELYVVYILLWQLGGLSDLQTIAV